MNSKRQYSPRLLPIHCCVPVSYTHLDVYKRQVLKFVKPNAFEYFAFPFSVIRITPLNGLGFLFSIKLSIFFESFVWFCANEKFRAKKRNSKI